MIDTSTWKEFCVGELFSCETTLSIPSKNDLEDGDINYITRSAIGNGFSGTCGNKDHKNKGNCITIGAEGFVAFWQSEDFVAGNKVYTLRHPDMNEINGLFVCSALNALSDRYSFADARVLDKIKVEIIKLPAASDGQPDWDYMESYMKAVMEESEKALSNLKKADDTKHLIDVSGWGEFDIAKLFDMSLPKGDLQVKKVDDGDIPLITPSNFNNGMLQRISKYSPSTLYSKGSLTVDMFGNAYYQEEDFFVTAHGHVNVLLPRMPLNIYTGSFLASAIRTMFFDKYGFNEMCTQKVLKAESVWLPITSTGEPDWRYMEDYMKNIMNKQEIAADNLSKIA